MASNNQDEALELWQGLTQVYQLNIRHIIIVVDSLIMIRHLVSKMMPNEVPPFRMLHRIQQLVSYFE